MSDDDFTFMTDDAIDRATEMMDRAMLAAAVYSQYQQADTDRIVQAVQSAAFAARVRLARLAVEETGMGVWRDKVVKHIIATRLAHDDLRDLKTVGVIADDPETGIVEIAQPLGPILALIPVTNPTATALFQILIALKTRNPILISPPPRAWRCCTEAARICYEAALAADAPEDCIQWPARVSRIQTQTLMQDPRLALILAAGGSRLAREARGSETPVLGGGAGNVPVFIDASADVPFAVEQILRSKTFDHGTACASEQALIVTAPLAARVESELTRRGAVLLTADQVQRLEQRVWNRQRGAVNPDIVGQPAARIAAWAGIPVPEDTRLLVAPLAGAGAGFPLSSEILAPILAYYVTPDFDAAIKRCLDIDYHGGIGHTASIFSTDDAAIRRFAGMMTAGRILVNTPAAQGAAGGLYNRLTPSLMPGGNRAAENISARHLLRIQRIAYRRDSPRLDWFDQPDCYDESGTLD